MEFDQEFLKLASNVVDDKFVIIKGRTFRSDTVDTVETRGRLTDADHVFCRVKDVSERDAVHEGKLCAVLSGMGIL